MGTNIISSITAFDERFPDVPKEARYDALKKYFDKGGVINAAKTGKVWPKLVYPSPLRIESQIKELVKLKILYEGKHKDWQKKLSAAKTYHSKHQLLKFSDPLYWKHKSKSLTDSDYRSDAEKVGLPIHLVADVKWKPMIRMFIDDLEYRKNLVETVQTSIVYKDSKKVAKYAYILQDFRAEVSTSKIADLSKKVSSLDEDIRGLELIKKWAKE